MATLVIQNPNPPLTNDLLAHYGVLGMKWGKRKQYTSEQIDDARTRQHSRAEKIGAQQVKLANIKAGGNKTKIRAQKQKVADMEVAWLRNPDRVAASRMKRGEKAALLMFGAGYGGVAGGLPGAAIGVGTQAAILGGMGLVNRRIEYKQENKLYKRKKVD